MATLGKTATHYVWKTQLGILAQGLRHAAWTRRAGFKRLDHQSINSPKKLSFVNFEGPLRHDGSGLANRDDEPLLARRA